MDYPIKALHQLKPIIRGFRKARNLTQGDVAKRLGITQQSYSQFENNPAAASLEKVLMVLAILEVNMSLNERSTLKPKSNNNEGISTAFDDIFNELSWAFDKIKKPT